MSFYSPAFEQAACATEEPEIFFDDSEILGNYELAKAICGHCAVRRACLTEALDNKEVYGVYGGTTGKERSDIFPKMAHYQRQSLMNGVEVTWRQAAENFAARTIAESN
jgi:WhiB family redox-sensing transcriptional regulator